MRELENLNLVCLSESELLQWQARGYIHLAVCRIMPAGKVKNAELFALAPCLRLDDAKSRIVVQFKNTWCDQLITHPLFLDSSVLSLDWDLIEAIGPALSQFNRRLEVFNLPLATWDISEIWDDWIFIQGRYERIQIIAQELRRMGFNSLEVLGNKSFIEGFVGKAMRPKSEMILNQNISVGWSTLFENRDQILKKLRFEGHSDRLSFLQASVKEIININADDELHNEHQFLFIERDSGWLFKDLTAEVIQSIYGMSGPYPLSMEKTISPIIGAIYLRLFDELHYGSQDWSLCFKLLRFTKYSIDSYQADLLTLAILSSFAAEELKSANLAEKFNMV